MLSHKIWVEKPKETFPTYPGSRPPKMEPFKSQYEYEEWIENHYPNIGAGSICTWDTLYNEPDFKTGVPSITLVIDRVEDYMDLTYSPYSGKPIFANIMNLTNGRFIGNLRLDDLIGYRPLTAEEEQDVYNNDKLSNHIEEARPGFLKLSKARHAK